MKKSLPYLLILLLLTLASVFAVLYLSDGTRHNSDLSALREQKDSSEKQLLSFMEELNDKDNQIDIQKSEIADKGIDSASEPTARLISELCRHICPSGKDSHVLEVFGYYVGRWIYLMDACDDIEKDIKDKNYNPFKKKYYGNIENTMKYCNDVLNMTSARIVMSYELLELNSYKAILDNIIYSGLSAMQKKLVTDRFDKSDKRKADYYNLLDSSIVSEKTRNSI